MFFKLILINIFAIISAKILPNFQYNKAELDATYWNDGSKIALFGAYHRKPIQHSAKNVILFLGDGMGVSTITPARILKGQLNNKSGEESKLAFEEFPYVSLIKTYNVDHQVPDSAGTATAFMCGVKTNKGVIGVTAQVGLNEKDCTFVKQKSVSSILKWAQDSGKSTGIITTARITHATPAGGYASVANRDWEGSLPPLAAKHPGNCKDIARQLVEDEPGHSLNVILGGGIRYFLPNGTNDTLSGKPGQRTDGQNLIEKWLNLKRESGLDYNSYQFVNNRKQLENIDYKKIDHLFGLFNYNHMAYDMERDVTPEGEPSLEQMTAAAIRVLEKNDQGFVLLVEGGRIDHSHHDNYGVMALYETVAFDRAIARAAKTLSLDETLIVVTADHSHTFTMNGYAKRGNNIFGVADEDDLGMPFTTLMYANGPGYQDNRLDPETVDSSALRYRNLAAVGIKSANHGGEDVALYSVGPMAHLFHGTQEQPYIAHAMAFASCVGQYRQYDHCIGRSSSNTVFIVNKEFINYFIIITVIVNIFSLF